MAPKFDGLHVVVALDDGHIIEMAEKVEEGWLPSLLDEFRERHPLASVYTWPQHCEVDLYREVHPLDGARRVVKRVSPPLPPQVPLTPSLLYRTLERDCEMHGVCDNGNTLVTVSANFVTLPGIIGPLVGTEINVTYGRDNAIGNDIYFTQSCTDACNWLIEKSLLLGQWHEKETVGEATA